MLDIKIRIVTFTGNHPVFHTSFNYFMEAWKINVGAYCEQLSFTVLFQEAPNKTYINVDETRISDFPVEFKKTSAQVNSGYQHHWPMSFLDENFDEDIVIFCTPHILVVNDLSWLIEKVYQENTVFVPEFVDQRKIITSNLLAAKIQDKQIAERLLSTQFIALPKKIHKKCMGGFLPVLAKIGQQFNPSAYRENIALMANALTMLLHEQDAKYQILAPSIFHQFNNASQAPAIQEVEHPDYDRLPLFCLTDALKKPHSWSGVFQDVAAVRDFLDNSELTGPWLYFQRDLRRIHTSLNATTLTRTKRNLFKTTSSPYYIYGLDFVQQSAGIRALHYLCHALNESGQEAYITCQNVSPQLRTPVLTEAVLLQHYAAGRKPIMVYPEIVSGDPMAAGGVVVRWLLNQAGHIGGDTAFAAEDIIFAYDNLHLTQGMHGEILHIPTGNTAIFNNDDNPYDDARDLVCYYAHKYLYSGSQLTEQVQGAISLCKDQVLSHAEIAAILRRSKLLYVYESTSLIEEALLCGCPVAVIETDYWRNNMANYAYNGDIGVVMDDSPESLALAAANVHKYRELHENVVVNNAWRQIDRFIAITQSAAKALHN